MKLNSFVATVLFGLASLTSAGELAKHKSTSASTTTSAHHKCKGKQCLKTLTQDEVEHEYPLETSSVRPVKTTHLRPVKTRTVLASKEPASCTYTVTAYVDHTVTSFVTPTPTKVSGLTAFHHIQVTPSPVTVWETVTNASRTTVHPVVEVTIPASFQAMTTVFTTVWETVTQTDEFETTVTKVVDEPVHTSHSSHTPVSATASSHALNHTRSESAEPTWFSSEDASPKSTKHKTSTSTKHKSSTSTKHASTSIEHEQALSTEVIVHTIEVEETVTQPAAHTTAVHDTESSSASAKKGSGVPYTFTDDGVTQTILEEHPEATEGLKKRQIPFDRPTTTNLVNAAVSTITRVVPATHKATVNGSVVSVVGGVTTIRGAASAKTTAAVSSVTLKGSVVSVVEEMTTVVPVSSVSVLTDMRPISSIIEEVTTVTGANATRRRSTTSRSSTSEFVVSQAPGVPEITLTVTDVMPAPTTTVRTFVSASNSTSSARSTASSSSKKASQESTKVANSTSAAPAASSAASVAGPCAKFTRFHTDANGVKYEVHDQADSSVSSYKMEFTANMAGCFKACDKEEKCNALTFAPIGKAESGGNCYLKHEIGKHIKEARAASMCSANRVSPREKAASSSTNTTSVASSITTKSHSAKPTFSAANTTSASKTSIAKVNTTSTLPLSMSFPKATPSKHNTTVSASEDPAVASKTSSASHVVLPVTVTVDHVKNKTVIVDHTVDPATQTVDHTAFVTHDAKNRTITVDRTIDPATRTVDHTAFVTQDAHNKSIAVDHTSERSVTLDHTAEKTVTLDHTHVLTVDHTAPAVTHVMTVTDFCKDCVGGSTTFVSTSVAPYKTSEAHPRPHETKSEGYHKETPKLTTYPAIYATHTSYSTSWSTCTSNVKTPTTSAVVKPVYNTYTVPQSTAWVYPTPAGGHAKRGEYEPHHGYEAPHVTTSTIWATSCTTHSSTTETHIYPYTTTTCTSHPAPPQTYAPPPPKYEKSSSKSSSTHQTYVPPPASYPVSSSTHHSYVPPPATYPVSSPTHKTYAPPPASYPISSPTHHSYVPPPTYPVSTPCTTSKPPATYVPPPPPKNTTTPCPSSAKYVPPPPAKNTTTPCPSTLQTTPKVVPSVNTTIPAAPTFFPPIVTHPYMNTSTTTIRSTRSVTQETTVYKTKPTQPPKEPLPPSTPNQPEQPQAPTSPEQPPQPETPKSPEQPPAEIPSTTAPAPSGPSVEVSNDADIKMPGWTIALGLMISVAMLLW